MYLFQVKKERDREKERERERDVSKHWSRHCKSLDEAKQLHYDLAPFRQGTTIIDAFCRKFGKKETERERERERQKERERKRTRHPLAWVCRLQPAILFSIIR